MFGDNRDREHELERDLAQFDWHDINCELPPYRDLVVVTDGEARWLDMLLEESDDLRWQGHIATHWHAIRAPPKPRTVETTQTEPDEIKF